MIPKIVTELHSPYVLETILAQHRKRENLVKGTHVVPAKYPPDVKLENFHNSRVPELWEIMCTLVCENFGVFIIGRVNIRSLA